MSSALLKLSNKEITSDKGALSAFWINLVGLFGFLSFATLPTNILLTKYVGSVPLKLSGLVLGLAAIAVIFSIKEKRIFLPFLLSFVSLGYLVAGFLKLNTSDTFLESIPVLEFVGSILVFSAIRSTSGFKILTKYLILCLWVSLLVELAMISGIIENPFGSRASFSGSGISDIGLGRFVTPTHLLAGLSIGVIGHLWLSKKINFLLATSILLPATVIAGLASTRLLVVLIAVPVFLASLGNIKKATRVRILGLLLAITAFPFLIALLSQTLFPQLALLSEYSNNFAGRFFSTFFTGDVSATDASTFYRSQESFFVLEYVNAHSLFGGGFSATYMSYPLINDTSFLGIHGNAYVHNTYLWVLVKTGLVGLFLLLAAIWLVIFRDKKASLNYEAHLFISSLASLLVIAFIWNILANAPDSTLFGAVIGLVLASRNSSGFISVGASDAHTSGEVS